MPFLSVKVAASEQLGNCHIKSISVDAYMLCFARLRGKCVFHRNVLEGRILVFLLPTKCLHCKLLKIVFSQFYVGLFFSEGEQINTSGRI